MYLVTLTHVTLHMSFHDQSEIKMERFFY